MSYALEFDVKSADADLTLVIESLEHPDELYTRLAAGTENWLKDRGLAIAAGQHRTAEKLGAAPTGHLEEAYAGIASVSDTEAATLLIPRASRLRAAFGGYVLTPVNGGQYLTIAANAAAYGRRAREFDDLFFARVGPNKTPILARNTGHHTLEVMYVLITEAEIPEDPTLIPFEELAETAEELAAIFIDEKIEQKLITQTL